METRQPIGYRWRSSKFFILATVGLALFAETFLYGFLVPILAHMLEVRLGIDPSETQKYTTTLLSIHGLLTVLVAPVVAHFADKTPNRKVPLLMALTLCLVGTILVAWTPSVWALFLGRYLQAVGGSATWIVCFAILLDCTAAENLGKITGITMTFVTAGIISGPTVAGVLLELFGYWATWSVPMIILVLDIIAPLLMIQTRDLPSTSTKTDTPSPLNGDETITDETTALLSDNTSPPPKPDAVDPVDRDTPSPRKGFHRIILSDYAPTPSTGYIRLGKHGYRINVFLSSTPVFLSCRFIGYAP
ncbi:hypothetical protein EYZ11_009056 [Aspergillus tanneri]|uniref:Major facilitator superfamily (MFS) profile domain-containing protein n=1 Tax=Aspergillus tanneri TaxID=1220188 RepID=A0A4S3J8U1_9EURO|nr:hypothetical protein EYZ11_009056 [Aspergillus tanneri]